jgi:hypothetical protein
MTLLVQRYMRMAILRLFSAVFSNGGADIEYTATALRI